MEPLLTFVGSSGGAGASSSLPVGWMNDDFAVVFAFNGIDATVPSLPTGWTHVSMSSDGTDGWAYRIGWRRLQEPDSSTGTWTGATSILCVVYRGGNLKFGPVVYNNAASGTTNTVTYPARASGTSTGWVLAFAAHKNTDTNIEANPPSFASNLRGNVVTADDELVAFDSGSYKNTWVAENFTLTGTAGPWVTVVQVLRLAAFTRATANKESSTSLSVATSDCEGGWLVLFAVACDNLDGGDGDFGVVSSVTDTAGHTWTKIVEYTNGQGAAGAGVTLSLWYTIPPKPASFSVTANFRAAVTAKVGATYQLKINRIDPVNIAAIQTRVDDGVDAGPLTLSGLENDWYYFLRFTALEGVSGVTPTADWTEALDFSTSGGTSDTNIALHTEVRGLTTTSATSDPTTAAADSVSALIAIRLSGWKRTLFDDHEVMPNIHHPRQHAIESTADHSTSAGTDGYVLRQQGDSTFGWEADYGTIELVIDGGGSAITTGVKADVEVPYDCEIQGWTLAADQAGSIVIDVWKDTYANFPPTSADTITGTEKPTLSSSQTNQDLSLTTWNTLLNRGDWLRFNVDSALTVTRVTLSLRVRKT